MLGSLEAAEAINTGRPSAANRSIPRFCNGLDYPRRQEGHHLQLGRSLVYCSGAPRKQVGNFRTAWTWATFHCFMVDPQAYSSPSWVAHPRVFTQNGIFSPLILIYIV